jgi:hypothetical protein
MLGGSEGRIGVVMERKFPIAIRTRIPTPHLIGIPVLQICHVAIFLKKFH